MPSAHSKHSASGFEAATLCPGKRTMERGLPDRSSTYADEGTAAHQLLEWCVSECQPAASYIGREIDVNLKAWTVTTEMVEAIQTALDNIAEIVGDGMLLSEQRVCYASYLNVPDADAWGTSDIIALRDTELQVHDYKHGMGVEVNAEDNPQMKLYGLGALAQCQGILGDFETVRLVIHQPRIKSAPSEWTISVADLEAWGRGAARSSVCTQMNADNIGAIARDTAPWQETFLRPNDKSCKFCKAKSTCPALRDEVLTTALDFTPATVEEFDEAVATIGVAVNPTSDWIGAVLAKADLIDGWLKAVRAEAEHRLLAGESVAGYKLVTGKRGNRGWSNPTEAEAMLKGMRLKTEEMYDLKLISPTSAEKLAKPAKKEGDATPLIGPRQWPKVQALITQSDGRPTVVPVSDPRAALEIGAAIDEFSACPADVSEEFTLA